MYIVIQTQVILVIFILINDERGRERYFDQEEPIEVQIKCQRDLKQSIPTLTKYFCFSIKNLALELVGYFKIILSGIGKQKLWMDVLFWPN